MTSEVFQLGAFAVVAMAGSSAPASSSGVVGALKTATPARVAEDPQTVVMNWVRKRSSNRRRAATALKMDQDESQLTFMRDLCNHLDKWPEDQLAFDNKRKQLAKTRKDADFASDRRTVMINVEFLGQIPVEYASAWVIKHSDFDLQDIRLMLNFDSQSVHHLVSYGTGLSLQTRIGGLIETEALLDRVLDDSLQASAVTFGQLKAGGLLLPTGKLDWTDRVFKLAFDGEGGRLSKITHIPSGMDGTIPVNLRIYNDFESCDAQYRCRPEAAKKLRVFFPTNDEKVFGHIVGCGSKKDKDAFAAFVHATAKTWEADLKKTETSSANQEGLVQVKATIESDKKTVMQDRLKGQKEKAKAALEASAAKRICVQRKVETAIAPGAGVEGVEDPV